MDSLSVRGTGTSRLSLPDGMSGTGPLSTTGSQNGTSDTTKVAAAGVLLGAADVRALISTGKQATNVAKTAVGTVNAVVAIQNGAADAADTTKTEVFGKHLDDATTTSDKFKVLGGAGAALGLVGNVQTAVGGVQDIAKGDLKDGSLALASAGLGATGNVGVLGNGIKAGAELTNLGTDSALVKGAGLLGETLGKFSGPLTIASGAVQTVSALTKNPPDVKSAVLGGIQAVGGVAMCFPPVGTAIGGALVAGATIVQNWGAICHAGEVAGQAIGTAATDVAHGVDEAAHAVASGVDDAAKAVGSGVDKAAHAVASFFSGL